MRFIPYILIFFRLALAPVILHLAYNYGEKSSVWICVLMALGLISDIFDGIIARKTTGQTTTMRRLDSQVDMVFWLSIGVSSYVLHPEIINQKWSAVVAILSMEAACYVISLVRFGKETCTHAFLSKMWGLTLLTAFISIIGFGYGGFTFTLCVMLGLISHVDRILITLILPEWTHDVPSAYHAWLIRKGKTFKKNSLFN